MYVNSWRTRPGFAAVARPSSRTIPTSRHDNAPRNCPCLVSRAQLLQDALVVDFFQRCRELPALGVGVSTEYGAHRCGGLDPHRLHREKPQWAAFLEIGIEIEKGLDEDARRWVQAKRPTTYHFLDINLDEPEDFDRPWLDAVRQTIDEINPAWLCGDAGMWHMGPRDRNHMLLLPPVLSSDAAKAQAQGVIALREACLREVLPENPPASAYVGSLHILEFFAQVCEQADTGMLLDVSHLAMFQHLRGRAPLDGCQDFDFSRVVELHIAGGAIRQSNEGFSFVEDTHGPDVLPASWEIFEHALAHAPNLRAIVVEGERNQQDAISPVFERVHQLWTARPNPEKVEV